LSQADAAALMAQLRSLDGAVATMLEDGSVQRAAPARQCHAGVVLYQAVSELPPAISANVMVALIRETMRSRPR
jgi:hypothetical protein